MWCFQSMETHVLPQTFALPFIPFMTHPSDGTCRLYANTSSTLLKRRSAPVGRLPISPYLRVNSRFGWFWECPNGGEKCQYRHALPAGFVLKSQRKALEDAEKANTISLEEFLEVEVRTHQVISPTFSRLGYQRHSPSLTASQTGTKPDTCDPGDVCKVEANKDEQEASRRGSDQESQGGYPRSRKEYGNEWARSRTFKLSALQPFTPVSVSATAFDRKANCLLPHSSRSTPSGSKKKRKRKRIGIWTSIENRRKWRTRP